MDRFSSEMTDGRKIQLARGTKTPHDVQELLAKSLAKYKDSRRFPKARKWLEKSISRIDHFSNIINIFISHNPEYVALVWGAIKLVLQVGSARLITQDEYPRESLTFADVAFTTPKSAQNHENTMGLIAKGISQIAEKLSHIELATVLYPTERMREAVGRLYADIIQFLIRAHNWCNEGSLLHALHRFTRPAELRYKDLLERIDQGARTVERLTNAGAQVELREVKCMLEQTNHAVVQMAAKIETMVSTQALHSSALINTSHQLSDLQVSQIMTFVSTGGLGDHVKALQYHQSMQRRRARNKMFETTERFWESPKLADWSRGATSGMAIIKGNSRARFSMRDFAVELIKERQLQNCPVLWALPRPSMDGSAPSGSEALENSSISPIDILKHLVWQAMRLHKDLASESTMSLQCARFHGAVTEQEWMDLLGSTLVGAYSQLYMLVDDSTLDPNLQPACGFPWQSAFERLFTEVGKRVPNLRIKVMFLNYGTHQWTGEQSASNVIVPVRVHQTPVRKRKHVAKGQDSLRRGKQRRHF